MTETADAAVAAVAIKGARKTYKTDVAKRAQVAVDDLSLAVAAGRTTGLIGHNGAGKTTTIRMILGLVKPDQGEVTFFGKPLVTGDRRRIGYMPETARLPANLTPAEMLADALTVHAPPFAAERADAKAAVTAKLAEVGLAEHRAKRISHLSKGMGRRLAWALATVHDPDVLILDEPTSGLDPLGRRDLLARIEAAKSRGKTILLCTHELAQVASLCDVVHVLRRGKLVHSSEVGALAGAGYEVQVSGVDQKLLIALGDTHKLPLWSSYQPSGFVTRLGLKTYGDAAAWAAALLKQGLVVLRFGENQDAWTDELLAHFGEEDA